MRSVPRLRLRTDGFLRLIGDGTDTQGVVAWGQARELYPPALDRMAPALVEPLQFP